VYIGHRKSARYFCYVFVKVEFCRQILICIQISIFMKMRPVGAELFHADQQIARQSDRTKLIVSCRNFASAPGKKG
jgi:hypothetical protein